ncbi:ATP-binding cassette domain-containing protein, partial [Actinomadura adrarensis]
MTLLTRRRGAYRPQTISGMRDTAQAADEAFDDPSGHAARAGGARTVRLTKSYGTGDTAVRALNDVTVAFPKSGFTAIMGPSGAGKSTLMHCVAGLDSPTSGQVYVGDHEL